GSVFVLVVLAPPEVRRSLWPPMWGVLPLFLSAEWREVQEIEINSEPIHTASGCEICPVDAVPTKQKDAEPETFALVGTDSEVVVEVTTERGEPGHGPAHPLLKRPDLGQRRARHQGERRAPGAQMGEVPDVVGERGTAGARFRAGREHEVVDDQLTAA